MAVPREVQAPLPLRRSSSIAGGKRSRLARLHGIVEECRIVMGGVTDNNTYRSILKPVEKYRNLLISVAYDFKTKTNLKTKRYRLWLYTTSHIKIRYNLLKQLSISGA